jgi:hypothetical protein
VGRRRLALTGLAGLVVLVASIAVGRSIISSPSTTPAPDARTATDTSPSGGESPPSSGLSPPSLAGAGFLTFNDRKAGFSIGYPRRWKRLEASDKQVRLLAADGTKTSLLVRVAPVGLTVTRQTLGIVRKLTDSLVSADGRVRLLAQPQQITLDGVPGYRYFYTYGAPRGGKGGAHAHYFLFWRKRLFTLVLQVPGARALNRDSVLLNRVAATFRVTQ